MPKTKSTMADTEKPSVRVPACQTYPDDIVAKEREQAEGRWTSAGLTLPADACLNWVHCKQPALHREPLYSTEYCRGPPGPDGGFAGCRCGSQRARPRAGSSQGPGKHPSPLELACYESKANTNPDNGEKILQECGFSQAAFALMKAASDSLDSECSKPEGDRKCMVYRGTY